jgi:hypothetical protein
MRGTVRFLEDLPRTSDFVIREGTSLGPSVEKKGESWEVVLLAFGKSKRPPYFVYTKEAAQKSLTVIKGAKLYANSNPDDFGHTKDAANKRPMDIVGIITDAWLTESDLRAKVSLLPSGDWLKKNLSYAEANNLPMPYELSIDAGGSVREESTGSGKSQYVVESFSHFSVDVVERGAAGGKIVKMVASQQTTGGSAMRNKLLLLFSLFYPTFLESAKIDGLTVPENELYTKLMEADKPQSRFQLPDGFDKAPPVVDALLTKIRESLGKLTGTEKTEAAPWIEKITESLKPAQQAPANQPVVDPAIERRMKEAEERVQKMELQACGALLQTKLSASKLPLPLQEDLREQFKERIFKEADLDASIERTRKTYGKFTASAPNSRGMDVNVTFEESDKVALGIQGFFLTKSLKPLTEKEWKEDMKGIPPLRSIREAYILATGDTEVSGLKSKSTRLSESMQSADWASIISTAINKRLVRDYPMLGLDTWRPFVDIVPATNFLTRTVVRYGGYGDLPTRAEGAPYMPLTSPGDEKATYTPSTRGGTEDLTREQIMNDQVGAVQKIPQRLNRAAAWTLHKFVYEFLNPATNAVIYDTAVLYITAGGFPHANYGTGALDATYLAAARLRMMKQTEKPSSRVLGLRLKYLLIPPDLESSTDGLVVPAYGKYNDVPDFLQKQSIVPIVVPYWTDTNNWAAVANPADIIGLELAFINGQETPEVFVSDLPNVGSWFTNDKLTYKIRHEYGGAVTDFRAFDGSVL